VPFCLVFLELAFDFFYSSFFMDIHVFFFSFLYFIVSALFVANKEKY